MHQGGGAVSKGIRSSELAKVEEQRALERAAAVGGVARRRRACAGSGWDWERLRSEVEQCFREHGAKVFREERG
jgi:hypothetical protein